jgi:hypothetical protein
VIETPRRSVTRFFVPLIDVLTLLFCIFLVMPLARDAQEESARTDPRVLEGRLQQAEMEARRLREENDKLRRSRSADLAEQVNVGVLNLVPDRNPLLFYTVGQQRYDLRGPADVQRMVAHDKELSAGRPWVYVIRYPTDPNIEVKEGQRQQVFDWFKGLARVDVEGHYKQ